MVYVMSTPTQNLAEHKALFNAMNIPPENGGMTTLYKSIHDKTDWECRKKVEGGIVCTRKLDRRENKTAARFKPSCAHCNHLNDISAKKRKQRRDCEARIAAGIRKIGKRQRIGSLTPSLVTDTGSEVEAEEAEEAEDDEQEEEEEVVSLRKKSSKKIRIVLDSEDSDSDSGLPGAGVNFIAEGDVSAGPNVGPGLESKSSKSSTSKQPQQQQQQSQQQQQASLTLSPTKFIKQKIVLPMEFRNVVLSPNALKSIERVVKKTSELLGSPTLDCWIPPQPLSAVCGICNKKLSMVDGDSVTTPVNEGGFVSVRWQQSRIKGYRYLCRIHVNGACKEWYANLSADEKALKAARDKAWRDESRKTILGHLRTKAHNMATRMETWANSDDPGDLRYQQLLRTHDGTLICLQLILGFAFKETIKGEEAANVFFNEDKFEELAELVGNRLCSYSGAALTLGGEIGDAAQFSVDRMDSSKSYFGHGNTLLPASFDVNTMLSDLPPKERQKLFDYLKNVSPASYAVADFSLQVQFDSIGASEEEWKNYRNNLLTSFKDGKTTLDLRRGITLARSDKAASLFKDMSSASRAELVWKRSGFDLYLENSGAIDSITGLLVMDKGHLGSSIDRRVNDGQYRTEDTLATTWAINLLKSKWSCFKSEAALFAAMEKDEVVGRSILHQNLFSVRAIRKRIEEINNHAFDFTPYFLQIGTQTAFAF